MDKITENNVVALLEECVANGNLGPSSLWLWFLQERPLIERTLENANFDEYKSDTICLACNLPVSMCKCYVRGD
jgi:hypothetical protein